MWVARDKYSNDGYNTLYLYKNKPVRKTLRDWNFWQSTDYIGSTLKLDKNMFPDLTWDDGPLEVFLATEDELKPNYRERYKKITDSESFKEAYNNMSIGEGIRIDDDYIDKLLNM